MTNTQTILSECSQQVRQAFPDDNGPCSQRDAALYLAHTERGASIRALARAAGAHPSTVSRAVRRVEARRDDPLFDRLVEALRPGSGSEPAPPPAIELRAAQGRDENEDAIRRAAKTALRRLSEPGAFLVIASGVEKGGIFCAANGHRKPIAMLAVETAAEFLRRDWIRVAAQGRSTIRYRITEAGRAALKRILAEDLAARRPAGFAEAQSPFQAQHSLPGTRIVGADGDGAPIEIRVNLGESPLGWLARRKGPDGRPFLTVDEVEAGERLRADFERSQIGPSVAQDWSRFLTPGDRPAPGASDGPGQGASAARDRISAALAALGPGLADVAFRVCCHLEGLETCEKRLGWAARSGKVVLKIALQRLSQHYGFLSGR
ncbi:MAG: DUF6456 domain-containing protein [Paracoccaceae bacterium]